MLNNIRRIILMRIRVEHGVYHTTYCYCIFKWYFFLTNMQFRGIYKLSLKPDAAYLPKGDEAMVRPKQPKDDKSENLRKYGALNPHPQKVTEKTFSDSALEFFDPRDLVQVKYEMLRAVDKEGRPVKQASEAFGFSRPAFYQAQSQFKQGGVTRLVKKRPGPKSAHKLTADILAFIEEKIEAGKPLRARKLAPLIREKFGKDIHPRSIERAVLRRKKKRK